MENTYIDYPQREKFPLAVRHKASGEVLPDDYHTHDYSEIIIVKDGQGIHCANNKTRCIVKRNDVLVVHSEMTHAFSDCETLELYEIIYDRNVPLPALETSNLELVKFLYPKGKVIETCDPVTYMPEYDHELIINLIRRLSFEIHRWQVGRQLMIPTMFVELVIYLNRSESQRIEKEKPWLLQAPAAFLSRTYHEPFDIEKLKKAAGMSGRSLYRHFKKEFGTTPLRYLQLIRVQAAMEKLQHTSDSIENIALGCGFCDSNHFCKVFRESVGVTPSRFRKGGKERAKLA